MGDVNDTIFIFGRNSSLRLRTHKHWDRSRPLGSAVVEYQAPSARSDSTFAGDRSGKRALEIPDHTKIVTGPHFRASKAKVDVGTVLRSTMLSDPRTNCTMRSEHEESHSYSLYMHSFSFV